MKQIVWLILGIGILVFIANKDMTSATKSATKSVEGLFQGNQWIAVGFLGFLILVCMNSSSIEGLCTGGGDCGNNKDKTTCDTTDTCTWNPDVECTDINDCYTCPNAQGFWNSKGKGDYEKGRRKHVIY